MAQILEEFSEMDKIICLGKNYADHAKEMKEPVHEKPVLFLKPPSIRRQVVKSGDRIVLSFPKRNSSVHPECEVAIWVTKGGFELNEAQATERIQFVTLGLDITLRDVQSELKKAGHPWTLSKVFPDSAVFGPWLSIDQFPEFLDTEFTLYQAGVVRQRARPSEMLMKPAAVIAYVSQFFPLGSGDVLMMGTPAGVGPVNVGEHLKLEWGKINYEVEWPE